MIQDIFLPTKIGSYYIFRKRVLSFEITNATVQASLLVFSKRSIVVENSMQVVVSDHHLATISNAIKKIAVTIGSYDQVITTVNSSAIIFKELTLPFIGRQKIDMIIRYEVEPLLPFSLDEAVIDFLVTHEDKEKNQSTVLVAALRKSDLHAYTDYFDHAGVVLDTVSLDLFALYEFYRHTMYVPQAQTSLLLIDISFDALKLLYIQKGVLQSIRLVPLGLFSLLKKIDPTLHENMHESFESIIQEYAHKQEQVFEQLYQELSKQINLSLSFFQKQTKNFVSPAKIMCIGAGTLLPFFGEVMTELSGVPVEILDIKRIAARQHIEILRKIKVDGPYSFYVIQPLAAEYSDINFLATQQKKKYTQLVYKQLILMGIFSLATVAGILLYTHYQLNRWDLEYEKSRKQMVVTIKDQMGIEIKNSKRITEVVSAAQNQLQQTKKVCLSFAESKKDFLYYLQELCDKIDRESLGLVMQKLTFHDKEIIVQGKITESAKSDKPWENLKIFTQELMNIKGMFLKNIPPELAFNVTLLINQDQDVDKEEL